MGCSHDRIEPPLVCHWHAAQVRGESLYVSSLPPAYLGTLCGSLSPCSRLLKGLSLVELGSSTFKAAEQQGPLVAYLGEMRLRYGSEVFRPVSLGCVFFWCGFFCLFSWFLC